MDEAEAFARATKRKLRIRLLLIALPIAAPLLYVGWRFYSGNARIEEQNAADRAARRIPERAQDSLRASIAATREVLAAAREGWARAVAPEALAALSPGPQVCDQILVPPTSGQAATFIRYGRAEMSYAGNLAFRRHAAGEPIPPLDIDDGLQRLDKLAAALAANSARREDASVINDFRDWSLVIVVDREVAPILSPAAIGSGGDYTPGRLAGKAYLYSYRQKQITCTGTFDVQHQGPIEFDFSYIKDSELDKDKKLTEAAQASLRRNLVIRVQQALAESLREATRSAQ